MREIDLSSPQGNVFAIAGIAQTWNKQLRNDRPSLMDEAERREECVDYNGVLDIFDEWFKGIVSYTFINDPRDPESMTEQDDDDWDEFFAECDREFNDD